MLGRKYRVDSPEVSLSARQYVPSCISLCIPPDIDFPVPLPLSPFHGSPCSLTGDFSYPRWNPSYFLLTFIVGFPHAFSRPLTRAFPVPSLGVFLHAFSERSVTFLVPYPCSPQGFPDGFSPAYTFHVCLFDSWVSLSINPCGLSYEF